MCNEGRIDDAFGGMFKFYVRITDAIVPGLQSNERGNGEFLQFSVNAVGKCFVFWES